MDRSASTIVARGGESSGAPCAAGTNDRLRRTSATSLRIERKRGTTRCCHAPFVSAQETSARSSGHPTNRATQMLQEGKLPTLIASTESDRSGSVPRSRRGPIESGGGRGGGGCAASRRTSAVSCTACRSRPTSQTTEHSPASISRYSRMLTLAQSMEPGESLGRPAAGLQEACAAA
jgi:hypothetical protein